MSFDQRHRRLPPHNDLAMTGKRREPNFEALFQDPHMQDDTVFINLPPPWMPFCVTTGYRQFFPACASHTSVRGNIGNIFRSSFTFLRALESHVLYN